MHAVGDEQDTRKMGGVASLIAFYIYHPTPERKTPHKATRATFPKMGRSVDDLYNHQHRTPEFALILVLRPSSFRNCCSPWRIDLKS